MLRPDYSRLRRLFCVLVISIHREIIGTLRGFDEFVNMVLDDATEVQDTPDGRKIRVIKDKKIMNMNIMEL